MRSRVSVTANTVLELRFAGSEYFSSEAADVNVDYTDFGHSVTSTTIQVF